MADDSMTRALAAAKKALGQAYETIVGYDPFEDDPTISVATVCETLCEVIELHEAAMKGGAA